MLKITMCEINTAYKIKCLLLTTVVYLLDICLSCKWGNPQTFTLHEKKYRTMGNTRLFIGENITSKTEISKSVKKVFFFSKNMFLNRPFLCFLINGMFKNLISNLY